MRDDVMPDRSINKKQKFILLFILLKWLLVFHQKNYFTEKEEHCSIFICAHFMWGLRLGLGA